MVYHDSNSTALKLKAVFNKLTNIPADKKMKSRPCVCKDAKSFTNETLISLVPLLSEQQVHDEHLHLFEVSVNGVDVEQKRQHILCYLKNLEASRKYNNGEISNIETVTNEQKELLKEIQLSKPKKKKLKFKKSKKKKLSDVRCDQEQEDLLESADVFKTALARFEKKMKNSQAQSRSIFYTESHTPLSRKASLTIDIQSPDLTKIIQSPDNPGTQWLHSPELTTAQSFASLASLAKCSNYSSMASIVSYCSSPDRLYPSPQYLSTISLTPVPVLRVEEREKRSQIDILYRAANRENSQLILSNPQEGPHLNEDEFFDALETTLEKMDLQGQSELPQETAQETGGVHKMHNIQQKMQETIAKYKIISKEDPETSETWSPVAKEGGTRIYRKEEEKENVMVDYLVAITQINGVTAAELAEVFHSKELKSKWDHSIEADKLLEQLDEHCAIYHQILKRVWPTAQRDMVYASHKQKLTETDPEYPDWIVVNVSCDHKDAPDGESGFCRATIEVVMYCQTIILKKKDGPLTRDDVACKIVYSATVNPGGWAPAAAVRAISKKEYPKFIKKISSFTQEYKKGQAISF